jgi:hypothetical protein
MKKIFLLLVLGFATKGFGQTYSIELEHEFLSSESFICTKPNSSFELKGDNTTIFSGLIIKSGKKNYSNNLIDQFNTFKLSMTGECIESVDRNCEIYGLLTRSIIDMIKGDFVYTYSNCDLTVKITSFKPNVTIANSKSSNEICSGEELNLQASPGLKPDRFPDEAYHWQYSIDKQATWIDVPIAKNNTPRTDFSINELLANSEQFFNETIYFRLGYGQNRPFTDVIPIRYSPCGPTINSFAIKKPNCKGGKIQKIDVFFKDDLKAGETLNSIYLRKMEYKGVKNDNSPLFGNTSDIIYSEKEHSIPIIAPYMLENGMHYQIIYQTFLNGQPRGVLYSPVQQYLDPTAVTCSIKVPDNILCNEGKTNIEITASGGTGSYYFYKDNIKLEGLLYPEVKEGKYYINNLIGEPAGKAYKILVTDTNGCYE